MKQIIKRNRYGYISHKYYVNDRGRSMVYLSIGYFYNNTLWWKSNWFNGKQYGLQTVYHHIESGKINKQKYYL